MEFNPAEEIFGTIRVRSTDEPINYYPVQISKFSIGIVAKAGLNIIDDLELLSPNGPLRMRLMSVETDGVPDGNCRYHIMLTELNEDLEQIYSNSERFQQFQGSHSNFQFARFETTTSSILSCKTFGSTNPYRFKSVNASKSGLLIVSLTKQHVPFRINTILEFILEPNSSWLNRSIKGVAKVVHERATRGASKLEKNQYFGIELKDLQGDGELVWRQSVTKLEQTIMERFLKEVDRSA